MNHIKKCLCLFVLFGTIAAGFAEQNPNERALLERQVAGILRQSNVDIRHDIKKVFALGDIYLAEKNDDKAMYYYLEGLKSNPWNLLYQLKAATLLHQYNKNEEAIEKAKLVHDFAEQTDIIEQAASLLAKLDHPIAEEITLQPDGKMTIMLIPIGEVNPYLLKEVVRDIQKTLGVQYVINDQIKIDPGQVDRPYAYRYLERVYDDLKGKLSDTEFKEYRIKAETPITYLDQYENRKKFILTVFKDVIPPEEFTEFQEILSGMENEGQYHANRLIGLLKSKVKPPKADGVKGCIGVTSEDIYASDYNFLFGQAMGNYAVMSYHRFTAEFNDAIPNRKKLRDRTLKQLISSSFHMLGISRCSNPTCARAYPNSLEEHDRKESGPCASCLNKWKKAVGTD